jgi:hypothetical protein
MPYFAMVVVIEADDAEDAEEIETSGEGRFGRVRLVGEPWPVQPLAWKLPNEGWSLDRFIDQHGNDVFSTDDLVKQWHNREQA